MKKRRIVLIVIVLIITLLILPFLYKDKSRTPLIGPDISEIEYSEITFENNTDSIILAGMLMLPIGEEPFPVIIFIHGSGASFRKNAWYLSVAKHLTNNGIAVILPDKRGCEKSEGEWIGADFTHLASDVLSAVEYVKNQNSFKYSKIGILGMSQGGWIAPVAASQSVDIDFVATMSGATVTSDEQLIFEEINNIEPYTYKFIAKIIAPITAKRISKMPRQKPFVGFDPIPYWNQVSIPVFFGYGGNDKNVPVEESVARINTSRLSNVQIKTYLQGGHGIKDPATNKVNENYLNDLVAFINMNISNRD